MTEKDEFNPMYKAFLHVQITSPLVVLHMYAVDFGALLVSFVLHMHAESVAAQPAAII